MRFVLIFFEISNELIHALRSFGAIRLRDREFSTLWFLFDLESQTPMNVKNNLCINSGRDSKSHSDKEKMMKRPQFATAARPGVAAAACQRLARAVVSKRLRPKEAHGLLTTTGTRRGN